MVIGNTLIGFCISFVYGIILYLIGKSRKDRTILFYALAGIPIVFNILLISIFVAPLLVAVTSLIVLLIIYILCLSERAIWLITLRKVSGEKRPAWFFIIFFIPLFGWLLYWVTETW